MAKPLIQPPQHHTGPPDGDSLQSKCICMFVKSVDLLRYHNQTETVEEIIGSIPSANWWKLDKEIDRLNEQEERIPRHLGTIASSMINWEGCIADELGLTEPEREDIVQGRYALKPEMQRL